AATEYAALAELKAIAGRNKRFTSYIGMGYTAVQLPPVILRNMRKNPKYITILAPIVTYFLTIFAGTGNISLATLPVIAEVAKE
ncbi:hypothetical protein MJN69_30675, partial [Salmonella enterica subsp. enterica serovar Kentucky]|nr:hypothetical protein [Salmonella enterica subsp. enterica serovar Kentucky]